MTAVSTRKPAWTRKATWEMTDIELARVFADHFAYRVHFNWIYDPQGTPVGCGWEHFAARLEAAGWIVPGKGIDWRRAGEHPRLSPAKRSATGWAV